MVDVGKKRITPRTAALPRLSSCRPALAAELRDGELALPQGTRLPGGDPWGSWAPRGRELIPLCHPLPLDDCKVEIAARRPSRDGSVEVVVRCTARTKARTGVEMEALTGATIAALTLYDMGKAVTHGIVLKDIRLLAKSGGKKDYRAS